MESLVSIKKYIKKISTLKNIFLSFFLAQILYVIMVFGTFPVIEKNSNGLKAMDLTPTGYSYQYVRSFFETLSPQSRNVYLFIQEPLDIIYPAFLSLFLVLVIAKLTSKESYLFLLGFFPVVFDYLENIMVVGLLLGNQSNHLLIEMANISTIMKAFWTVICYLAILILAIRKIISWRKEKQNEKK